VINIYDIILVGDVL